MTFNQLYYKWVSFKFELSNAFRKFSNAFWQTDIYEAAKVFLAVLIIIFIVRQLDRWQETRGTKENSSANRLKQNMEARVACSAYISDIEKAETESELDSLFHHAIGEWPQWEKQLSRVYKNRRRRLLK